jgi:hypothetical protein
VSSQATVAHGWSFLVARGRRKGYRTVLAPGFLTDRNLQGLLSDSVNGDGLEDGRVRTAELDDARVGPITICFRTELLTAAALNGGSSPRQGLPTDEQGRPLELLYGIVACGRLSGPLDHADLRAARSEALRSYRRFLEQEERFGVDASRPFALRGVTAGPERTPREPNVGEVVRSRPQAYKRRPPRAALSILAAAVIVLVAWWAWPGSSDVDVRIAGATLRPSSGQVDCRAAGAVTVRWTITADAPTQVTFHGEHPGGATPKARLQFAERGSKSVLLDATTAVRSSPRGRFVLVVDSPQRERRAIRYDVGCLGPTGG